MLAAFARWSWVADLAASFRVHIVATASLALAVFVLRRRWRWVPIAGLAVAINIPAILASSAAARDDSARQAVAVQPWRLGTANLWHRNRQFAAAVRRLRAYDADALVLIETSEPLRAALAELLPRYRFRVDVGPPGPQGLVVLSRWPLLATRLLTLEGGTPFGAAVTLQRNDSYLHVFAVHLTWPVAPKLARERNAQLRLLAQLAARSPEPLLLVGDLNVTEFSPHFRDLLVMGRLTDHGAGRGWQPTWPALLAAAGLRIDHVLGRGIQVERWLRRRLPGADHFAIIADLQVRT
ncbi:MAG: endonuclease/exonuclease/phosphatase family protein [Steroidobacteraceae bacterium]|nr:endonuclease/exonuclease/phosphatase family protein [Steroidobacteraceae bacterium]MDW8259550.1 endonuclease/exonuclease/phosphatase family protein [Gammaproteobacteria bacterium]